MAVLGQLMFAVYLIGFYGPITVAGRFEDWNRVMPHGYVSGDIFGNLLVGLHLGFAVVVMVGGALQVIPMVRRRWPAFHRWNGRVYLSAVLIMSAGGLTMMGTRGTIGGPWQKLGTCINALVIMACAGMALHHAVARRIGSHRRWALRLFLAASGVWFARIGFMFWLMVNRGPVGFDPKTFRGPFLVFLNYAQFLLPLLVLELYLRALEGGGRGRRLAVAATLAALTLITAAGTYAATIGLWLPHL